MAKVAGTNYPGKLIYGSVESHAFRRREVPLIHKRVTVAKRVQREEGSVNRSIVVGVGKNNRLVFKKNNEEDHAGISREIFERLQEFWSGANAPKEFKLIFPAMVVLAEEKHWIQEYFNKPSLEELMNYFRMLQAQREAKLEVALTKKRKFTQSESDAFRHFWLKNKESYYRCKQFVRNPKNLGLDFKLLESIHDRIKGDIKKLSTTGRLKSDFMKSANFIVLGRNRDGKVRLAIIDY